MDALAFLQDPLKLEALSGWDVATYPGIAIGASFFVWLLSKFGKVGKLLDGREEIAVLVLCFAIGNVSMFALGHFSSVDPIAHQAYLLGAALSAWLGYDKFVKRQKDKKKKE